MDRVAAIMEKEWREVTRNGMLVFTAILLCVVFTAIPMFFLGVLRAGARNIRPGQDVMRGAPPSLRNNSAYAGMSGPEVLQAAFGSQFMVFFLIAPAALPMIIASYSIVGEKRERSLEPLLATPVSVGELLLAKAIAAALPGLAVGWLSVASFALLAHFVVISGAVYKALFSTPMLLALIFAAPLLTVLSAIFGLMVSSRVNDPRAAQSFGGLLILPLILTVPFRVAGLLTVDLGTVMVFILALISLDAVLLYFATRIFQRETILTRWR